MKRDFGVEVEWQAFQLRTGVPAEGMPRPQKPGEGNELSPFVQRLSERAGLKMRKPSFIASSRPALEAAEYAKTQGRFDQFHLAVFKAYFEYCRNIGQRSVLLDIAKSSGLDGDELERCLDEGWYADTIDKQTKEARERGIGGAPTFVIGGNIIVGIQPYPIFARVITMMQNPQ